MGPPPAARYLTYSSRRSSIVAASRFASHGSGSQLLPHAATQRREGLNNDSKGKSIPRLRERAIADYGWRRGTESDGVPILRRPCS